MMRFLKNRLQGRVPGKAVTCESGVRESWDAGDMRCVNMDVGDMTDLG